MDRKITKEELKQTFKEAEVYEQDVAVELTVPGCVDTEIIIVKNANLDNKLQYYLNNYDEELKLKRCNDIQIINLELMKWCE